MALPIFYSHKKKFLDQDRTNEEKKQNEYKKSDGSKDSSFIKNNKMQ